MLSRVRRSVSPSVRSLLIAQVPADFADWLDYVAILALLTFAWQVDPLVLASLAVALGAPYLLVGPAAGVIIDRSDLKTVLVLSNLGRAAASAMLAFAWNWQVLLVVVFLRSCADAFFTPAKQAAIQTLTDEVSRLPVNGLSHAINQSSKIVAPALGGVLLLAFQSQDIFFLNALVSLCAAAAAATICFPARDISLPEEKTGFSAELRSGWREARSRPRLSAALLLMMAGFFAMFFYDTLIAPLTRELGFSPSAFGYALTAVGCGGVLGSLAFSFGSGGLRPFAIMSASGLLAGLATICLGLSETTAAALPLAVFLLLFFAIGLATAAMLVPVRSIIQTETAPARMARVSALSEALNTMAMLTAPFCGAALANLSGIGEVFVVGGVLVVATGLTAAVCDVRFR